MMSNTIKTAAQKNIFKKVLVAGWFILGVLFCQAIAGDDTQNPKTESSDLLIYLPREVMVRDSTIKLGHIGVVRGPQDFVARANEIPLGRFAVPGQEIVIDRNIVLSRLASHDIPASQVTLQGAEEVTVTRQQKIISGDEFVKLAETFVKDKLAGGSISQWSLIRKPEDLNIGNPDKDLRLSPRLIQSSTSNQVKVEIAVFSGDRQIGSREVVFVLQYSCRTTTATVDIPAGTAITEENVKIETHLSNSPEPAGWKPPYGQVAKRSIPAETMLQPYMIGTAESPVIIKRNQNVVIKIEKPGFLITAIGKAMQDGKAGEYIKIRNIDSQRIIVTKINQDGSVEPVF
jgi:flagella basal body P-ring formation protein FlgA